jgi:hypothetical protein
MRIAMSITITIAIMLAAAAQQAHGWAQSCAGGNKDVCCHLEQHGWTIFPRMALTSIGLQIQIHQLDPLRECDPTMQTKFNDTVPLMCQTDCWGGAIAFSGSFTSMPTQAEVFNSGCAVHFFVNGKCPPAQPSSSSTASASVSSTASASVSSTASAPVSSSTASATESSSSSSSTGTNTDDGAGASAPLGPASEDSTGAAAPHAAGHWAFALAFALMLWH